MQTRWHCDPNDRCTRRSACHRESHFFSCDREQLLAVHDVQHAVGDDRRAVDRAAHVVRRRSAPSSPWPASKMRDVAVFVADVDLAVDDQRRAPHGRLHVVGPECLPVSASRQCRKPLKSGAKTSPSADGDGGDACGSSARRLESCRRRCRPAGRSARRRRCSGSACPCGWRRRRRRDAALRRPWAWARRSSSGLMSPVLVMSHAPQVPGPSPCSGSWPLAMYILFPTITGVAISSLRVCGIDRCPWGCSRTSRRSRRSSASKA